MYFLQRKLQVLQKHIIGMSQAYSELLESTRKLKLENSDQLSQLHSQLEHAQQRAKEAEDSMRKEAQCSEAYKDDLQAVLEWVTGGHSVGFLLPFKALVLITGSSL